MLKHRGWIWILIPCCLLAVACGYRFTGGGDLPQGIRSVNVSILENRTAQTGLETIITNDLIYEFTRSGKVSLTDRGSADAVLSGVIESLQVHTVAYSGANTASARRVTVAVDLKLTTADGRTVWSVNNLSANETYDVASGKLATEQNKSDAIVELSKRLAEKAFNSMTDDF